MMRPTRCWVGRTIDALVKSRNPLDEVTFEGVTFAVRHEDHDVRIWTGPSGDGFGLYHDRLPPDIGASLTVLPELRSFYRAQMEAAGMGLLVATSSVDRCVGLRTLCKPAQQPSGRTYVGAITLPFRDFSYVLKIQAEERGMTGQRDAVILDQLFGSGAVTVDPATDELQGWADDPYNPTIRMPMVRNCSERPEYDAMFPDYPPSRARARLAMFERSVRDSPRVRGAAPFVYSTVARNRSSFVRTRSARKRSRHVAGGQHQGVHDPHEGDHILGSCDDLRYFCRRYADRAGY